LSQTRAGGQGEYSLRDRVAVVTGGSGGIGAATARRLAAAGARVVVGYNANRDRAESLVEELDGTGHLPIHIPMDDSLAIAAAAELVRERLGRADVLINSAGVTRAIAHANLDELDDSTFDRILITNVRGPFSTVRAFAPLLRASGDGVVVNLSSISGTTGLGSSIAYCASKAALDTMSLSLARVLAPEVRVLTVSPAAVATDFVPGRGRQGVEKQAASTPLRTVTEPDDVALAVLAGITHLRLTTGSSIVVDGGRHLA
jgi:3-oxoacyl-[acyl-carrier protein] reductase